MRALAATALLTAAIFATPARADDNMWPQLVPGEVRVIDDVSKLSGPVLAAVGFSAQPEKRDIKFTFFTAPHGHHFMIASPCCGETGKGAALFEMNNAVIKPVDLVMGDPRLGFTSQGLADDIQVDDGAVAVRSRVGFSDCEDGDWGYYYRFDDGDRLTLMSVIDTGCTHIGVRELYHAKNIDVGKWWMH